MLVNSLGKQNDIIEIHQAYLMVQPHHNGVHKSLERRSGVAQPKGHSRKPKRTLPSYKRRFVTVLLAHGYLKIATAKIKRAKVSSPLQGIQTVYDARQGISIFTSEAIHPSKINTQSQITIFLHHYHDIACPGAE